MSLSERAVCSIHDVHDLIHAVFTRPAAQTEALRSELMAVFADNFSMVTTTGAIVDRQQVGQLFERGAGARPGLEIEVSDVQVVWQAGASVAVRYKETHRLQGQETARYSLAIVECGEQRVVWVYLHETAVV